MDGNLSFRRSVGTCLFANLECVISCSDIDIPGPHSAVTKTSRTILGAYYATHARDCHTGMNISH